MAAHLRAIHAAIKACVLEYVVAEAKFARRATRFARPSLRRKFGFSRDAFEAQRCCERLRRETCAVILGRACIELEIVSREIERHAAETGSAKAKAILSNWEAERKNFLQVCPKEMVPLLSHPLSDEPVKVPAE